MPEELCQFPPKSHYVSLAQHSDPSPLRKKLSGTKLHKSCSQGQFAKEMIHDGNFQKCGIRIVNQSSLHFNCYCPSMCPQVCFPRADHFETKGEIFQLQWRRLQVWLIALIDIDAGDKNLSISLVLAKQLASKSGSFLFSVKDMDGRLWFRIEGSAMSLSSKRTMTDADGERSP